MNRILLIIIGLISLSSYGQDFVNDWKVFNCKNWTVEIKTDTNQYLGQSTQGHIIFHCRKNQALEVEYFVFQKNNITESFKEKIYEWSFRQSCLQIIDGDNYFRSFTKRNYYYLLEACPSCNTYQFSYCRKLNRKIKKYVTFDKN